MALSRDKAQQLEEALRTNRRIAMAIGIIMATHRVDQERAFGLLRLASQNGNRKVADIADEVIDSLEIFAETA